MSRLLILAGALVGLTACLDIVSPEACDDYVDYICDCHADDPEYDCEELRIVYQDAEGEELTDCQIALDEVQDEDDAAGDDCELDTGV